MFKPNWKKNFRAVPDFINKEVVKIKNNEIVVACAKKVSEADIIAGEYAHLGIKIENEKLILPPEIMPSPEIGKYSHRNIHGQEIKRDDLPKVTKTFPIESPNFGDSSKGHHTVYMKREVYLREFISPQMLTISIELIAEDNVKSKNYLIKFTVNEVLDKKTVGFGKHLFHSVNLLQENVGAVSVYPSDARMSDYLQTLHLTWEILPPGEGDKNIARILSGVRNPSDKLKENIKDRYHHLEQLKPIAIINGSSGFHRYFGAKFSEDLVVFENMKYGNAIYVMYENWEELSKRSRSELLTSDCLKFDRVIHDKNWKKKVTALVRGKLRRKF